MRLWLWIIAASAISYLTKLAGYLVPRAWLENPRVHIASAGVTVGLLASLIAISTFTSGQQLVIDARLVSLAVAAIALRLRAPFLLVVVLGAAAAALVRVTGWG